MQPRARRLLEGLHGGVDVLAARAGERRDGHGADSAADRTHALGVAGRRGCEPRLDDVDAEPLQLDGDLGFLLGPQRDARRLLAVAKRGVEDCDPARTHGSPPLRPRYEDALVVGTVGVCARSACSRAPPRGGESR